MQKWKKYLLMAIIAWSVLSTPGAVSSAAEQPSMVVVPIKLTKVDLAGAAFTNFASVKTTHTQGQQTWDTTDAEIFLSPDKRFDAGVYLSGPVVMDIDEPYGVEEFMYFLAGGVILTSLDGSKVEVGPGEAVLISADWRGRWDSPKGYRKIYVIYSPDSPLTE